MARRLAAILDADVVGFSRLMGLDEAATYASLKAHRNELFVPAITEHYGHVVRFLGGEMLAVFTSVVDAMTCAMKIQTALAARNENIEPERRMLWRIGVHVDDVVVEDDEIFGDGVNVATRLQQLAPPGGICMSQQVRDHVRSKLDFPNGFWQSQSSSH